MSPGGSSETDKKSKNCDIEGRLKEGLFSLEEDKIRGSVCEGLP